MDKLRQLLEKEPYPHLYTHKFIGVESPAFREGLSRFEEAFRQLAKTSEKKSNGAKKYVSVSYEFQAQSAAEILAVLEATAKIPDLKVVL